MPYDALAVANYFIDLGVRDQRPVTAMKLQKLIYYAHGLCLATLGKPLVNEQIEAWQYGPVVPSVYHEFKQFGREAITTKAMTFDGLTLDWRRLSIDDGLDVEENTEVKFLLEAVWDTYGKYNAIQLSNMTHQPGTPWEQIYSQQPDRKGVDIPDELMAGWFAANS